MAAQVADMHGRRVAAEVAAAVKPDAIDGHNVWRPVTAHGGEPIMRGIDQPLLNRCPIQEPVGRTVTAGKT
jgi:hypothetical protein